MVTRDINQVCCSSLCLFATHLLWNCLTDLAEILHRTAVCPGTASHILVAIAQGSRQGSLSDSARGAPGGTRQGTRQKTFPGSTLLLFDSHYFEKGSPESFCRDRRPRVSSERPFWKQYAYTRACPGSRKCTFGKYCVSVALTNCLLCLLWAIAAWIKIIWFDLIFHVFWVILLISWLENVIRSVAVNYRKFPSRDSPSHYTI